MKVPKYETIPHTADLGLRIFGKNLKGLFSNAAQGMLSLMIENISGFKPQEAVEVKVSGLSKEELLVSWLSELLYKLTEERWLAIQAEILTLEKKGDKFNLVAQVKGETIDNKKATLQREIKAVTYHNLAIKKTHGQYCVEIIFDV